MTTRIEECRAARKGCDRLYEQAQALRTETVRVAFAAGATLGTDYHELHHAEHGLAVLLHAAQHTARMLLAREEDLVREETRR